MSEDLRVPPACKAYTTLTSHGGHAGCTHAPAYVMLLFLSLGRAAEGTRPRRATSTGTSRFNVSTPDHRTWHQLGHVSTLVRSTIWNLRERASTVLYVT